MKLENDDTMFYFTHRYCVQYVESKALINTDHIDLRQSQIETP